MNNTQRCQEILALLKQKGSQQVIDSNTRLGITPNVTYGVSIPTLRHIAKLYGKNHLLAIELWNTPFRESRFIGTLIADESSLTLETAMQWIRLADSWDLIDVLCYGLFWKTSISDALIVNISKLESTKEFEKRTQFVLIASLARHDKERDDKYFEAFLPLIRSAASDNRKYVQKAVDWAIRAIGKRSISLNQLMLKECNELLKSNNKTKCTIARTAQKELSSTKVQHRLLEVL